MKVIQALGWYGPDASGGTEVYVSDLVAALRRQGIQSGVAAPRTGTTEETYCYQGTEVYRYPYPGDPLLGEIDSQRAPRGFDCFERWLSAQKADLYHQHSWTPGCGLHHLRAAKRLGLPTVLTVHVPGNTCMRGTLMLCGRDVCDGVIEKKRCGACWAMSRGMPAWGAQGVARLPMAVSRMARAILPPSRATTALTTPIVVQDHIAHVQEMAHLSDRIVAVSQWLYEVLAANRIPQNKLSVSRHGLTAAPSQRSVSAHTSGSLRVGFLGRWDAVKGVHILVDAVRRLPPSVPLELSIHALPHGDGHQAYERRVRALAAGEPRIHFERPLRHEEVSAALSRYDLLAVPSQWLETGPLVVLEALAAGVPVIGSRMGGIAEWIEDGVNGRLVPFSDVAAWSSALSELAAHREQLDRLRQGIRPIRTMESVATEMAALYQGCVR